ncbi:hypothetical protein [Calycomorphotria hydatis]|uniref:Uncharacterized protein n=1 Tax=Calycomorphotria hydatis TaxID=2528027 RepID=A0A517TB80_9PLAN|nr:hypothetical protein [Calycomorphotria hydatis]QDT65628.1 hypothetical protein V22_28860 [Calycomorphotria hydatis]
MFQLIIPEGTLLRTDDIDAAAAVFKVWRDCQRLRPTEFGDISLLHQHGNHLNAAESH